MQNIENENNKVVEEPAKMLLKAENYGDPIHALAVWMCMFTGGDVDVTEALLLVNVSRNLGRFVSAREGELSILQPRANLYTIIVAPPDEFHKSSQIEAEDKLTKEILKLSRRILDSNTASLPPQIQKVFNKHSDYIEEESRTFDGSPEGIADLFKDKNVIHFRAPELGVKLRLQNAQRYDTGNIEMLNNLYYGLAMDRILKKEPIHIPEGRYVTLFGDLHPSELTSQTLKLGLLRRCVIIKKDYKDIDLNTVNNAYVRENNQRYSLLMKYYIGIISDAFLELYHKRYSPVFEVDDIALQKLMEIRLKGSERIVEEEVPRYPTENVELILRIAVNMMLFEFAIFLGTPRRMKQFIVEERHIHWALSYLERLVENYKSEITRIETPEPSKQAEKMYIFIKKRYETSQQPIKESAIVNNFKWARNLKPSDIDNIFNLLVKRDFVNRITREANGKKWNEYTLP